MLGEQIGSNEMPQHPLCNLVAAVEMHINMRKEATHMRKEIAEHSDAYSAASANAVRVLHPLVPARTTHVRCGSRRRVCASSLWPLRTPSTARALVA